MKKTIIILIILIAIIIGGIIGIYFLSSYLFKPSDIDGVKNYKIENAFPNLAFNSPLGIYHSEDELNLLYVVEQGGKIYVFNNEKDVTEKRLFLDISNQISVGGERGLLGLAFHPNFTLNGYFYVDYTDLNGDTVISRFKINDSDPLLADIDSEYIILKVSQPYSNHNGGQIVFGLDRYLYIGMGDGGGAGDPHGHAQDRTTLLGSLLRIDVDSELPYSIPIDNPYYNNNNGYREEIYAYGLRNPWRFSFDYESNRLWLADVGQDQIEEINIIESGKNYGWNIMEGTSCYLEELCFYEGLELPIYEYNHNLGRSITGGFVYHGSKLPDLIERYVYGDYISGRIWALEYTINNEVFNTELIDTNLKISSFGIDSNNELYISAFDGRIYILVEN